MFSCFKNLKSRLIKNKLRISGLSFNKEKLSEQRYIISYRSLYTASILDNFLSIKNKQSFERNMSN
jgi:hypothetical protein